MIVRSPWAKSTSLRFDHQSPRPLRLLRLHPYRASAFPARPTLPPQRLQGSHATLVTGAARLDALTNPHLLLRQLLVELGPLPPLGCERRLLAFEVGIVVGPPVHQATTIELDDPGGEAPEERAIVRHEQQRGAASDQEVLHPLDGIDVEVIGGFVEQEDIGLADEGPREERLPPPATRGLLERELRVEPEVGKHRLDAGLQLPGVGRFEGVVQTVQFPEGGIGRIGTDTVTRLVIPRQQRARLTEAARRDLEDGAFDVRPVLSCSSRAIVSPVWRITSPRSGRMVPSSSFISVLLPAPLRPSRQTRSPRSRLKAAESSTRGPPNATLTSRIPSNAMPIRLPGVRGPGPIVGPGGAESRITESVGVLRARRVMTAPPSFRAEV